MTSTVPAVLFGTYTRGGSWQSGRGAVQTTANTTAAGLSTAKAKTAAKKMRKTRERRAPATAPPALLLVRKIFKFRGQLADPSPVVEAANEAGVTLVAGHVQELLLRDERPEPGQIGVSTVAHDPADHAGELVPLTLRQGLSIPGDRDEKGGCGAGDGVGEDLFPLPARDDLAPGADDVRDAISANANNVPAASHSRPLEVARPCVHCQAHYSS